MRLLLINISNIIREIGKFRGETDKYIHGVVKSTRSNWLIEGEEM